MRQTLKKGFTIAVSVMTAVWSIGISAFAPLSAAAAPSAAAVSEGDLVKASLPAVYYIGSEGKRFVFPNQNTYQTWWSDFDAVSTISDSELASIAIGGNATYRPGARLVKITTDPNVYAVGANGMLYAIDDQATAESLYGSEWNTVIDDVPDAFFTNYTVASGTVSANLGGLGVLPPGTVASVEGDSNVYVAGETENYLASGDTSVVNAMVEADSTSQLETWIGSVSGTTSMDLNSLASPDRQGTLEGGTGQPGDDTTGEGVTVTVSEMAEGRLTATGTTLSANSSGSASLRTATVEVCSDSSVTLEQLSISTAQGTVSADNMLVYAMVGENNLLYEESGTTNNNTVIEMSAADNDATIDGCVDVEISVAAANTSGETVLVLTSLEHSGSSSAAVEDLNEKTHDLDNVSVSTNQLLDVSWSSASPSGGSTLQSDGTMQQIFSAQTDISNHDLYMPNLVFELNGSLDVSNCEARVDGVAVSTDYMMQGDYMVFELPEGERVFEEGSSTWGLWCEVNGEAGQSVTPGIEHPAPHFYLYDNERVQATADAAAIERDDTMVEIAPATLRQSLSVGSSLNIAGASVQTEVVSLTNVTDTSGTVLNDEKTSGMTNSVVAAYKVEFNGSDATLSSITYTATGDDPDTGFSSCQIKIGPRSDGGDIDNTDVDRSELDESTFGGENNVNSGGNVVVTSNYQAESGEEVVILIICDVTASNQAYVDGDALAIQLQTGSNNVSFDSGATANFPATPTSGTTVTVRLLTSIVVQADSTARNLVQNGSDQVMGAYTIQGPTQEGLTITSVAFSFVAGVAGTSGCTSVTVENAAGEELATSQSLSSATTLTFSVNFEVAANEQYDIYVTCVQASSSVTQASPTGSTLESVSGTGMQSSQSFTANPSTAGATLNIVENGNVTASKSTNKSNRIIGPNKELLVYDFSLTPSIHEAQELDSLAIDLTIGGNAAFSDLAQVRVAAEGLTSAAAVTDICTRTVTGNTITCNFSSDEHVIAAGNTASFFVYAKGNSFGNIAVAGGAKADTLTPDIDADAQIALKGEESEATINPGSDFNLPTTGRVVTPWASDVYLVKQSIPSTLLSGQTDMDLFNADIVVAGSTATLDNLEGTCTTNDTTDVCSAGDDDLEIDGTLVSTDTGTTTSFAFGSLGETLTVGTHELRVLSDQTNCTNNDNVQLNLSSIDLSTSDGASTDSVDDFETVIEPFNGAPSNIITGDSNLCG